MVNVMSDRRIRRVLHIGSAVSIGGAVGVFVWSLTPIQEAGPAEPRPSPQREALLPQRALRDRPALASFEAVWDLDLQRPLRDVPVAEESEPAPPPIRLAGTLIDRSQTMGVFLTSGGRQEIKGVGQVVEGVEVLSIREDGATVRYQGRILELALAKGGSGS